MQADILRGYKTLKKILITLLLAGFVLSEISPAVCMAKTVKNSSEPQKVSISKTQKMRKKSDQYKYDYINYEWWSNFNDDILKGYIDKAIKHNYNLKMATIAVDEYYQVVKIQFGNELPMAGVGFAPALVKNPGYTNTVSSFAVPALVNYEADIFLKNHDKTKMAKKDYEKALQDERSAYITIASAVGATYLNIVKLDKMIELQEQIVADRKVIYDLMLLRNQEGLTSTSDTVKANKSYVGGQSVLTDLKRQRCILLNQLCVLLGISPEKAGTLQRISYDDLNFSGNIPKEISSEIIAQRPDYISAEKMIEKAGIDVRVAKKEFLPTINLTGVALFMNSEFGSLFTTKGALAALAGAINLPLFTGGKRIANLKLKKATYQRLLNNYYQTNLTAIQEVNDALTIIAHDTKKYDDTNLQSELEKKDYGLSNAKYEQGVISKLDLTELRENVLSTDKLVVDQKINCLIDYITLYKAVGSQL